MFIVQAGAELRYLLGVDVFDGGVVLCLEPVVCLVWPQIDTGAIPGGRPVGGAFKGDVACRK